VRARGDDYGLVGRLDQGQQFGRQVAGAQRGDDQSVGPSGGLGVALALPVPARAGSLADGHWGCVEKESWQMLPLSVNQLAILSEVHDELSASSWQPVSPPLNERWALQMELRSSGQRPGTGLSVCYDPQEESLLLSFPRNAEGEIRGILFLHEGHHDRIGLVTATVSSWSFTVDPRDAAQLAADWWITYPGDVFWVWNKKREEVDVERPRQLYGWSLIMA
jgi:hypothetical protein